MSNQTSFESWLAVCTAAPQSQGDDNDDEVVVRLRREARSHFDSLSLPSSSTTNKSAPQQSAPSNSTTTSVLQDISNASSTTPNGAIALLVSSLGPAFTSSATIRTKVRALHCLMGALDGCKDLTHGVRQAVGRFLVELCRPVSNDTDADVDVDDSDQEMDDYVDAANLTPEQVTQQLHSMSSNKRSKNITNNDDGIRDAAIATLKALLHSNLEIFPTQQSQTTTTTNTESTTKQCPITKAMGVVYQSMELRIEMAMLGIRYRCQTGNSNHTSNGGGDEGMWGGSGAGYETNADLSIEDGLSQLPRLKRSLCFDLLDVALDGVKADELQLKKLRSKLESRSKASSTTPSTQSSTIPTSLLNAMALFTTLTSSCMHGETDPRCLLQLLRLLNKVQQIMLPLFASISDKGVDNKMDVDTAQVAFPSIEIFDAVAPYYPIQFSPPKNDPHGITRELLQDALLAVLCERGAVYSRILKIQENSRDDGEETETMILLSARMFLERLEPPKSSDYDPPSSGEDSEEEKLAAISDLKSLLIPRRLPPSTKDGEAMVDTDSNISLNVTRVTPAFLSELSSSMARVHEEAISSDAKLLASAIRKFSSSLAYTLEPSKKSTDFDTSSLWESFVVDILRHLTPALSSSPQGIHGRASTAYFASLAAEGGLLALNKVLDGCYSRFLGVLSSLSDKNSGRSKGGESDGGEKSAKSSRDEEKLSAAMRGIAALISSCRMALQKWQRDNKGVKVYPHPLSSYLSSTIQKITEVLNETSVDEVTPLSLAAVAALESVLTCADMSTLEEEDLISLEKSISFVSRTVVGGEEEKKTGNTSNDLVDWKTSCARVLGAIISLGLSDDATNSCERINTLATSILPELLVSAISPSQCTSCPIRFDWIALAGSCTNGTSHVSDQIVSDLLTSILVALQSNQVDQRIPVMALSYIIRRGGLNVGSSFHSIKCSGQKFDIIEELCQPLHRESDDSMDTDEVIASPQLQVGMSALQLPDSRAKDEEVAHVTCKRASLILPFLVTAYECPSSVASCDGLVQFVDQIMPPLSEWDDVKLFVTLPLLAAVLTSSSKVWKALDSATSKMLSMMTTYLAEFSISSDHDAQCRSAASACLFSILFHASDEEDNSVDNTLMIQKLLKDVVSPALVDSLGSLKNEVSDTLTPRASASTADVTEETLHSTFSKVEDALHFTGVLGSTAACKGGPFSQIGDKIASFLIEFACTGTSQFPFTETTLQLVMPSEEGQRHPILNPASHVYILPASAFGGMLSVHNGGPFWRQRMTHKTLPILMRAMQVQAKSQNPPALGTLAVVCHMLCSLPASILGESNIKQILPTLLAGLVYFSKNSNALAQSKSISTKPSDLLSVILAALVKILKVSPDYVTKFIGIIIPSLLLISSPSQSSEESIPNQVLVLQCIEIIATHPHARNSVLREKDQVVAVLSAAVDHPSLIIRNAVVQARNVWCTLT